jgi:hypothetical protein
MKTVDIKKLLENLTKEKAPGPSPSFQVFHIIKTLELVSQFPVGRGMLAKKLEIGEGATRTLLERLKKSGMVSVSRSGCSVTKKGEEVWKEIKKVFPAKTELGKSELTLASCNVAILVKGKSEKIKLGMEQRDAAFLAGAKGATTLVLKKGKLTMPSVDVTAVKVVPDVYKKVMSSLKPTEDDVVVIGSADTWSRAEYGAIAASWTLFDDSD